MRLNRAWIERHIPHHGRMCLLDHVISWEAQRISCASSSHRDPDNPLRAQNQLGVACGIEYAAQAMAIHGALAAGALNAATLAASERPAPGFLAGLRSVEFHVLRLDDVADDLICDAVRTAGDRGSALYEFEVRCAASRLLNGRATVVLQADERLQS